MLRSIRELIADIRRTESEKRDSEIRALQAQINPHFLYNTLNTIQFLASLQGAENIKAVSLALSSMLHVNLNREKLIPVNEEIQYLKNYLEIQEYRFTGKFTSYFSSDTTSQSALIPKLLLQPIVENALLHGIAPQDRAGILQIKFFCLDGALHIRVKDNGKGISPQLLEALSHQPERDDGSHIGIANVRARVGLSYPLYPHRPRRVQRHPRNGVKPGQQMGLPHPGRQKHCSGYCARCSKGFSVVQNGMR